MRLTIACRKSDLARLQGYMVGDALRKLFPHLQIEYSFRASLGDQNQDDPLWKMPSQGVFTQDFRADLINKKVDLVVHSWKDLPTQNDGSTLLAATLKRADHRDLLLVKKDAVRRIKKTRSLRLLSSSPRRMYNLPTFLHNAFPGGLDEVKFDLVRGNIQTRLDKMLQSDADGLIVAKAAIDRLGTGHRFNQPGDSFDMSSQAIAAALNKCQWMVLPASQNPPAAAQGALVVEIAQGRKDLFDLLQTLNCNATFNDVMTERKNLAHYGGGCHQKIGIWAHTRKEGRIFCLRGKTDAGEELNEFSLQTPEEMPASNDISGNSQAKKIHIFDHYNDLFSSIEPPTIGEADKHNSLADTPLVANSQMPETYLNNINSKIVWTANVADWFELAAKEVWVHGSDDSLGTNKNRKLDFLLNDTPLCQTGANP